MRRFNGVLSALILVFFLLHGVFGALQLYGIGSTALKGLAWFTVGLIFIHTIIGIKLTVDTIMVCKRTGVSYIRENKLFWARRIRGFGVMILIFFHLCAFGYMHGGFYRLRWFNTGRLITQILFAAALGLHIISNIKPMLISLGIKGLRRFVGDILIVLSCVVVFAAMAFVVYWLRWNVF